MSGRTTLKSYFLTGATPTEANFADLIDSVLVLSEDLTDSLTTDSSVKALTASGAKSLNDSLTSLTTRVVTLENADSNLIANYYTKAEVDSQINTVSGLFNDLPYGGQISTLQGDVAGIESDLDGKAASVHTHEISDITNLTAELSAKATTTYVDNIATTLTAAINAIEPGSDESDDVTRLDNLIDAINTVITGLPDQDDLDNKSDKGHKHTVSEIEDIGDSYYNKTQTDTLLSSVEPKEHTHVEADITNLDKYTQAATDLKIGDHSNRTDNPHNVTKEQVSLGNVENLSVVSLFQTPQAQLLATRAEVQALGTDAHAANKSNPHDVTKDQVGLGNVPDINFQSLLDAHINATNPHNINLSFFDVYAKAETDARVQFYINALRYAASPSATDSAGAIGDYAYDADNFYLKTGSTTWESIPWLRRTADGKIKFSDPISAEGGIDVIGDASVSGDLAVAGNVSLGGSVNIDGAVSLGTSLNVLGELRAETAIVTSLDSSGPITGTSLNTGTGTIEGGDIIGSAIKSGTGAGGVWNGPIYGGTIQPNNTVKAQTGDLTLEGHNGHDVAVNDNLKVTGNITATGGNLVLAGKSGAKVQINDELDVTGATTLKGTTIGTSSSNSNLTVNGNTTVSGNLTVNGTTTSIDTTELLIEDNVVVLNKNQTGAPSTSLQSGFEVERGTATNVKFFWDESDDKWKATINGVTKIVSFSDDFGTAAPLDVPANGNATAGQVVKGNDSRLTDSRTPKSHTHGNISNDGKIGSTANKPVITTTGGVVTAGSFGTSANTFCQGNDSRLTNSRPPTSHTHPISQITNLQSTLNSKAASSHTHAISEVVNLQNTLNQKADISSLPSTSQFLTQSEIQALLYSK